MIHPEKPANFVPKITVSGCCIEHDGEVLLLLRSKVESHAQTWGFPSGKHEVGEEMYDAILREVLEETGLSLEKDNLRFAGTLYVEVDGTYILYNQFHTVLDARQEIQLREEEHSEYRWVHPDMAKTLPLIHDLEGCLDLVYKN